MIVTLTRMWLTNVVTQEMLGAYSAPDRSQVFAVRGEIRTYAGGRQRAIGSVGMAGQWKFVLVELTTANVTTIKTWMSSGVTVLVRDYRGQYMYGTFFDVSFAENPNPYLTYRADVLVQAVDVVEGV